MHYNPLLATDVYKLGHMEQYDQGVDYVYSYFCCRSTNYYAKAKFFGLRYYVLKYLSVRITRQHAEEFFEHYRSILGVECPHPTREKILSLVKIGYFPIKILSAKEGVVYDNKNVLFTIENTLPGFGWCVGFVESLLLKVWYPTTVATASYEYRKVVDEYFEATVPSNLHYLKDYTVHDFGYRSDSSEESAAISGAAHALNFKGSDTVVALRFLREYYPWIGLNPIASVPATEHSVMCSYGSSPEDEFRAFNSILDIYPTGIVSIVSDTYSLWRVLDDFLPRLKHKILDRPEGSKVVIRPDSGNPRDILLGDVNHEGVFKSLYKTFGAQVNSKGYAAINPKVGTIYGDAMYLERYKGILQEMQNYGWAANNLVIGVGGILRSGTRDTLGCAIKCTHITKNGRSVNVYKDPVTDPGKKSHTGKLALMYNDILKQYYTVDQLSNPEEYGSLVGYNHGEEYDILDMFGEKNQ